MTELSPGAILKRLRYALYAVFGFAFCLLIIEILDRTDNFHPITNALVRLVIYSIFILSLSKISSGYLKRTRFYYSIFLFFMFIFLLFIFDLTEEIPYLDEIPIIGHESLVRGVIENFSILGSLISAIIGIYFAVSDIALLRLELDQDKKRLQIAQDDLFKESLLRDSIIENAAEGLCVCQEVSKSPYLHFSIWNRQMLEITGYSKEEINRFGCFQVFFPEEKKHRLALRRLERIKQRKQLHVEEWPITRADGMKRIFRISTTTIQLHDEIGSPHILSLISDVTDRKELEERYLLAQKLESLGKMAGGIAHNINNLLTGISGNLDLAIDEAGPEPSRFLTNANNAANRAAELVEQLLAFCRKVKLDLKPHRINESVQEVSELIQQTLDPSIQLHVDLQPDLPEVLADPAQLHSVLMNLCVNSIDAIGEKQEHRVDPDNSNYEILIRTYNEFRKEYNEHFSVIEVEDNGNGIHPDVVDHIFEPFYTTKTGSGTGLGLASAFGIIKQHKGWLECNSESGQGAIFRIYLPVLSDPKT